MRGEIEKRVSYWPKKREEGEFCTFERDASVSYTFGLLNQLAEYACQDKIQSWLQIQ